MAPDALKYSAEAGACGSAGQKQRTVALLRALSAAKVEADVISYNTGNLAFSTAARETGVSECK